MPIQAAANQDLCILVENQGRIMYGDGIHDPKGLTGEVHLNGQVLTDWIHYSLPFNQSEGVLEKVVKSASNSEHRSSPTRGTMALFSGNFVIQREEEDLADTFLHLPGWHKGVAFLNGINLGRYWPIQGPQLTLYVPKFYLKPWPLKNRVVILEQDRSPCKADGHCAVEFIDHPLLNGTTPGQGRVIKRPLPIHK